MSVSTLNPSTQMASQLVKSQNRPAWAGLVRSEFRKCLDTAWARSILVVMALLTAAMSAVGVYLMKDHESWISAFGQVGAPATTLVGLLVVTLITEEWSRGTGLVSFTQVPDRARLLAAKGIVAMILVAVTFVPLVALSAIVALVAQMVRGVDVSWSVSLGPIFQSGLPLLVNVLLAFALSVWLKETTWATVYYFLLPPITVMLAQVPQLHAAGAWFSLGHSSSLFVAGNFEQTPLQILCSLLIWVALPLAYGTYRAVRDDVA